MHVAAYLGHGGAASVIVDVAPEDSGIFGGKLTRDRGPRPEPTPVTIALLSSSVAISNPRG
jgi:hypothetical protein